MINGSCLCGAVRYEISGSVGKMGHCYCIMCQKAHGAAYGTYARVSWSQFNIIEGNNFLKRYDSSPGVYRTFCQQCGSTLQFVREGKSGFGIATGTLDSDPGVHPSYQIWTSSKADWVPIDEAILSHETQPE